MTILRAADCETFDLPGIRFTALASPLRGGSGTAVWRLDIDPGTPGTPHQLTGQEIIHGLSGTASARIGDRTVQIAAGDTLVVPPLTDFALANPGTAPFQAIAVLPAGAQAQMPGGQPFTPPWAA